MDIELITIVMIGAIGVAKALGLPIAFSCGGVAAMLLLILWGPAGFMIMQSRVWEMVNSFALVAVPMFIFMAIVLDRTGIAADLYEAIYHWMGRLRGGLAMATVAACAILAAMVGIIGAGIVTMGLIALPAMLKRNYHKGTALGAICASGSLGILIPPSVLFILYGMIAGVSVGKLFLGGVGPGLLLAGFYIVYIGIRSFFQPGLAPALPEEEVLPLRQKLILLKGVILPVFLITAVLGSVFAGIATPSEAAGIGSLGALLCAAVRRRLTWTMLKEAGRETTKITCMVMWLVFGAYPLVSVYILAGGASFIEESILGLGLGPWGMLIAMQIVLIILGMLLDWISILILTMPIFVPIIVELGFCPLWFGILFNLNMQIGFLTPPFGIGVVYLKGVAPPEITITEIFVGCFPFLGIQIIALALVMIFPQIGTWLPGLM